MIFMGVFIYLLSYLKDQKELFVKPFLIFGFMTLSLAGWSIWNACFNFTKQEASNFLSKTWLPIFFCTCFVLVNKILLISFESDGGYISIFAWPIKYILFESIFWFLNLFFDHVIYNYEHLIIGTDSFEITLRFGCSGIQGINLFLICGLIFYLIEKKYLKVSAKKIYWLFLIGIAISFVGNIIRIATLITIGSLGYYNWALGSFHSNVGTFLFFTLTILFFGLINHRYSDSPIYPSFKSFIFANPVSPFILPFISLLVVTLFFKALTPSWDIWYPMKVLLMTWILFKFKEDYKQLIKINFSVLPCLLGILIFMIWIYLPHPETITNSDNVFSTYKIAWVGFKIVGSCILIPIIEELAFRGFLLRFFINIDFFNVQIGTYRAFSFLATSFIFGFLHQHFWGGLIAGAILNLSIYLKKSLFDAILCHAIANGSIALFAIILGHWEFWSL